MYLTAHHVLSPTTRREGFNALLYLHAGQAWEHLSPADVPEQNPGALQAQSISVAPPGNRVRSYLDIVAPDDVRWEDVHGGLMEFLGRCQSAPLPWPGDSRSAYIRVGMERSLTSRWQKALAFSIAPLRPSGWRTRPDLGAAVVRRRSRSERVGCSCNLP